MLLASSQRSLSMKITVFTNLIQCSWISINQVSSKQKSDLQTPESVI